MTRTISSSSRLRFMYHFKRITVSSWNDTTCGSPRHETDRLYFRNLIIFLIFCHHRQTQPLCPVAAEQRAAETTPNHTKCLYLFSFMNMSVRCWGTYYKGRPTFFISKGFFLRPHGKTGSLMHHLPPTGVWGTGGRISYRNITPKANTVAIIQHKRAMLQKIIFIFWSYTLTHNTPLGCFLVMLLLTCQLHIRPVKLLNWDI